MLGPGMQQPTGQQRNMRRTPHAMGACSGRCQMIECSAMASTKKDQVVFDHEKLDVYRVALELVRHVEQLLREMKAAVAAKNHLWRASESIVRQGKQHLGEIVSMIGATSRSLS